MKIKIITTPEKLSAALTEWHRLFNKQTKSVKHEAYRIIDASEATYGDLVAPYLIALLAEQDK